jgi:glycine betaine/proline transport system substrate-binding protein
MGVERIAARTMAGRLFYLALVSAVILSGCTPATPVPKAPIKLIANPWSSSRINAAMARLLLEQMGYPVTVVEIDENAQWAALAKGEAHASLEVWPSGHVADVKKYIDEEKSVENGGSLGPVGKIGWYIPGYLLAEHPELATWEGLKDPKNVALFKTAETGDKGRFLAGDPSWTQYDADIIRNLDLNFQVVSAGSEQAVLAELDRAYTAREPILFYFWTPHSAHARYDLAEIKLPPYTDDCYAKASSGGVACDYPPDPLFKILWPGLSTYAPSAYQLLKNINFTTRDQIGMIAAVDLEGQTPDQAAQAWLDQHTATWKTWVPREP